MAETNIQSQLAAAYGRLVSETGKRPTVRALKATARVSTDAAAAFLRDVAASTEVPPAPDLSAAVQTIWAMAWQAAADLARQEAEQQSEQLTADLTAATDDAEQQLRAADDARQALQEAHHQISEISNAADQLRRQLATLTEELHQARAELAAVRASERAACTRADRAEATVEVLQRVLDHLHVAPSSGVDIDNA